MSKHSLSPPPLPAAKRLHTSSGSRVHLRQTLSFNDSLYDELILCIFSHLSWVDLCTAQATSKNWCRLASDNELWRSLYLNVFGRLRLRGAKGFTGRSDRKQIRPLPGRARADAIKDWKWMFRISANWRRGRCMIEQLIDDTISSHQQTHILLFGPFTITASSQPSYHPVVNIHTPHEGHHTLTCESRTTPGKFHITAIAVDQAPSGDSRLAAFLSTGEIVIFSFDSTGPPATRRKITHVPGPGSARNSPVIEAAYHHPLLVALSNTFTLSLYNVSENNVRPTQTLSSFTSFPPTSLVLSTPSPSTYKLVLAYAIPVYPSHWSVGATELIIAGSTIEPSSSITFPEISPPFKTISTRTTRALDVPQGWIDEQKLISMHEQWSRKVSRVVDTQTDGKWVVLAPGEDVHISSLDSGSTPSSSSAGATSELTHIPPPTIPSYLNSSTTLQLYRLYLPLSSSVASPLPKLNFVRNLHGQAGPISSLAVADGRCVSLGLNNSLWVWDLEAGTGAEVASGHPELFGAGKGAIAFDDRKIVTAEGNQVVMRRFDI